MSQGLHLPVDICVETERFGAAIALEEPFGNQRGKPFFSFDINGLRAL